MAQKERTTKKQRELLSFISNFISGHGYGPSYREIMRGLGYSSVSTVANHVENLIGKGYLQKKDNSARSLEVVGKDSDFNPGTVKPSQEKWLIDLIEQRFATAEANSELTQAEIDELYVLTGALKVLGFESAANNFTPRLAKLKKRKK